MINYFYNIKLKEEKIDFYSDVLTNIRKDFYLSKNKQKGKITQNSDGDYINYEFSLEKDKMLKWTVSDNRSIISESRQKEDSKYGVNYYEDNGSSKTLTFSKFHTLLRVDYFDTKISTSPHTSIEPRKNNDDLCLLITKKSTYASTILFPMPEIDDEYILDKIDAEFEDYTAVASTNAGMVRFLTDEQLSIFEAFVEDAKKQKEIDFAPKSLINEEDAELANVLNPKDFNVKKNLSQAIDITMAEEFSFDIDDVIDDVVGDEIEEVPQEIDFIDFVEESRPASNVEEEPVQNEVPAPEFIAEDSNIDLCEEIVSEPVNSSSEVEVASKVEEIADEIYEIQNVAESENDIVDDVVMEDTTVNDTAVVTESVQPIYTVSPLQAEIDALFSDEDTTDTDGMFDIFDAPVVPSTPEIIDRALTHEVAEPAIFESAEPVESETVETEKPEVVEATESEIEEPKTELQQEGSCVSEPVSEEKYDVEQQEIPDCIIESSSSRYLYFGGLDEKGNRCGFGRTATDNGRTAYEGGYVDNKRDGLGAYYYKDGELCYYGEWKNNKREGFGIGISSVDKSAHIGRFVNNKPDSYGVRVDRDGEVRFVKKALSDGNYVIVRFDNDRIIITKYSKNGDIISENTTNMMYF